MNNLQFTLYIKLYIKPDCQDQVKIHSKSIENIHHTLGRPMIKANLSSWLILAVEEKN